MQTSEKRSTIFPFMLGLGNNLTGQFLLLQVVSKFLDTRLEKGLAISLVKDFLDAAEATKGFGRKKMTINAADPEYYSVGPHFVSV